MDYTTISVTDNGVNFKILAPGSSIEDIEINAYSSKLTVYIPPNEFFGAVNLERLFSDLLDVPNTTAELDKGVLILTIPYNEATKPKRIAIEGRNLKKLKE